MTFRSVGCALAAVLLATAAQGQGPDMPVFTPEAVKAHVDFLADDLLEGRDAGTRGYDIAARYVATRFEALGLSQIVEGSWYQPVTLSVAALAPDTKPRVTIGGQAFENGDDVAVGPFGRELQQVLEAGVVFAGYGLDAPDEGLTDYSGLDVKGKFVAVLSGFPRGMQSEIGAHLASEKAVAAQKHGAIGVVTIPTREFLKRSPWSRIVDNVSSPSVNWLDKEGKPFARAPGIRLSGYVSGAAAQVLFAGAPKALKAVLDTADKEGGRPAGFPLKPLLRVERTSTVATARSENVVAVIPGSDPVLRNEYVLLMAHLDHEGVKPDAPGSDKIYNGAMDNASGTATMLEVARAFAEGSARPKRSILLAAVTAEEDGLLGSQYLAKHPVLPEGGKLVGAVNLDMPILLYDFQDVIAFGAEHSTLGPIVAHAAGSAGVRLSPDPLPSEGLFTRSDHYRFVQEGVPSIFLMTGFSGEGEKMFGQFLATHYHKPSDQTDLPFNWAAAAKFAKINYLIAREIADAPEAPRWYENDFFGDIFAPAAPKAKHP